MERMRVLNWKPRLSLSVPEEEEKKKPLFSRDQSLERVVDKVVDKVVSSSSSSSRSDFDARVNVRDSLFLFYYFWGKKNFNFVFFLVFLLEKMELEGEKKRVKKHSPFLRRVFTIFLERRETPHSIQTRIDTHTNRLFQVRKSRPLAASNEKKKARRRFEKTTTKKTVVVARLSGWSFASTGKARKRREKVQYLRLLFFFSFLVFFVSSRR